MKRILILGLIILQMGSFCWAQSIQDKRRVEEEKRKDLSNSEFYLPEAEVIRKPDAQLEQKSYFSDLLKKEVADLSDAYKVLVVLMGVDNRFSDTTAQFDFLKGEKIIPKSLAEHPDHNAPLRKGAAAYMFARTMGIKGGITLRIFGSSQRYAFKELVYQKIMYPGNIHDVMSGPELILTLTQAADFMAERQNASDDNKEKIF